MAFKAIIICAVTLFVQSISGQCNCNGFLSNGFGLAGSAANAASFAASGTAANGIAANGVSWGSGIGPAIAVPGNNGPLSISSGSVYAPAGLSVISENVIDGALAITGNLPFLGTITVDGSLPTAGSGSIAYECGSGNIGIDSVIGGPVNAIGGPVNAIGYPNAGYGVNLANVGYGNGIANGIGCNVY